MTGIIKTYNEEKGYGFIGVAQGKDIFVHIRAVLDRPRELNVGDRVVFETEQGDRGPRAVNVRVTEFAGKPEK